MQTGLLTIKKGKFMKLFSGSTYYSKTNYTYIAFLFQVRNPNPIPLKKKKRKRKELCKTYLISLKRSLPMRHTLTSMRKAFYRF